MLLPAMAKLLVGGFPAPDEAPPAHLEVFCFARLSVLRVDFKPPEVPGFFMSLDTSVTANPLSRLVAFMAGLVGVGLKKFYCSLAPPSLPES